MPIDARIALGYNPAPSARFLDLQQQAAQLRNMQAQVPLAQQQQRINDLHIQQGQQALDKQALMMQDAKRKEQGIAALNEAIASNWRDGNVDDNAVFGAMAQAGYSDIGQDYLANAAKYRKDFEAAAKDQAEIAMKRMTRTANRIGSALMADSPEVFKVLVDQAVKDGDIPAEMADQFKNRAWDDAFKKELQGFASQASSEAERAKMAADKLTAAERAKKAPLELRKLEADAKLAEQQTTGDVPLTAKDKADLDIKRGTLRETQRANDIRAARFAFEKARDRMDDDATIEAILKTPEFYKSLPAKDASRLLPRLSARGFNPADAQEPTASQSDALRYYMRADKALKTIETLDSEMEKKGTPGQYWYKYGPRPLQSEANKSYSDAQRAFTEARLRQDSGAAIPQAEFENDAKTYFPQPGDSTKQIKEKAEARRVVLESLRAESGRAYSKYFGTARPSAANAPTADPKGRPPLSSFGGK